MGQIAEHLDLRLEPTMGENVAMPASCPDAGKKLYEQSCCRCHGRDAHGWEDQLDRRPYACANAARADQQAGRGLGGAHRLHRRRPQGHAEVERSDQPAEYPEDRGVSGHAGSPGAVPDCRWGRALIGTHRVRHDRAGGAGGAQCDGRARELASRVSRDFDPRRPFRHSRQPHPLGCAAAFSFSMARLRSRATVAARSASRVSPAAAA